MKIRQRLALRFTLVSALLTGAILVFIYMLTRGFVNGDFIESLTQQSSLEALHYATPNVQGAIPPGTFPLVNPQTAIYDETGRLLHHRGDNRIPQSWVNFLKEKEIFNAERGDYTTIGRKYDIHGRRYLVFVSDKNIPGQHELDLVVKAIIAGWLLSLALSYLAGLYFSADALRPVKHVVNEVNRINKDNLSYRLRLNNQNGQIDEMDELIVTFNALLNRIESAFVVQKRFVQNASHELKTPLTAIMAEAELALTRDRPKEEYKRTLSVILSETERLVKISQALLTLARIEEGSLKAEMERLDIKNLLIQTLDAFRVHHPDRDLITDVNQLEGYIRGNSALLQTALRNILDNAVKYSSAAILVKAKSFKGSLTIGVQDYGIGIPEADLLKIRSPLFRGSNVNDKPGAGLGLSLVDRIMRVHGGELDIVSQENKGTYCEITLLKDSQS
jgi:signal transduction histidine kinase